MWIVRLALRQPYTFIVLALLIALFGLRSAAVTPTDIFPNINIPVVSVVWSYSGMLPEDMAGRIVYFYERTLSTEVNDIQHVESDSHNGYGIVKIFFQPNVNIASAVAQVTAVSQTVLKYLPQGITPPYVLAYDASSVPILQLALSSNTLGPAQLFDDGQNFIRPELASVAGAALPSPYGGLNRTVQLDLDQQEMQAHGVSAQDVVDAVAAQNLEPTAGEVKIGKLNWNVELNADPHVRERLNDLPLKRVNGTVIYVRDVGYVHDGGPPQTNIVRVNGADAVLMSVLKAGTASTLDVISAVKQLLPRVEAGLPTSLHLRIVNDQSVFVRAAVASVLREMVIAAVLVGLLILLFLGSWRTTVISLIEIPLAILFALTALSWLGQSMNVMTLGGLALAVGILVDDGIVTLENINYHLEMGKTIVPAILDGSRQIVLPAFVTLVCLSIVFVPMFQLGGVAGYLFRPMGMAVVFALIGTFILGRTLVPTLAKYLLLDHVSATGHAAGGPRHGGTPRNPFKRFQLAFETRFLRLRELYRSLLALALASPRAFIVGFLACVVLSFGLMPFLGRDFFPAVDAGQIMMHVRAHGGTRIEDTARLYGQVAQRVRQIIPPDQIDSITENVGLPFSGINMAYQNTGTIGQEDGDMMISLQADHAPTAQYVKVLRTDLPREFPGTDFSFLPADIVSQILNFGQPAPIDLKVIGKAQQADFHYASHLLQLIRRVPGIADARIQQVFDHPQLDVDVNRTLAADVGLTERDVSNSLLVTLSGSGQVRPNFWLNTQTGVRYRVVTQTPPYRMDSISDLEQLPLTSGSTRTPDYLGGIADITPVASAAEITHYDVQPAVDIYATTQGRDLGSVTDAVQRIVQQTRNDVPKGSYTLLSGQTATMQSAFHQLYIGIASAILLVYLVIVVTFQSWTDPFIIITALPGALAGIVWMLFMTGTPLSVPALTGALMCIGIATANSILLVSFAREGLAQGLDAASAALQAGVTRLRPVLITALAMIVGMVPMALAIGEGSEQDAPLGRAVIGGLAIATVATLFFVPTVFSVLHRKHVPGQQGAGSAVPAEPPVAAA
ncbi:MAG TPA: efflux RND transporter permease subunit [Steroidobacteraceae bacterium]|nr:efflux RND transporter permease subunit [Steroidobacteraceae bacterium]